MTDNNIDELFEWAIKIERELKKGESQLDNILRRSKRLPEDLHTKNGEK